MMRSGSRARRCLFGVGWLAPALVFGAAALAQDPAPGPGADAAPKKAGPELPPPVATPTAVTLLELGRRRDGALITVLEAGRRTGVQRGDRYVVTRAGRPVGLLEVVVVFETTAAARVLEGAGAVEAGMSAVRAGPAASDRGRIKALEQGGDHVTVSLGRAAGLRREDPLMVLRGDGDEEQVIGELIVVELRRDESTARVLSLSVDADREGFRESVKVGDRVRRRVGPAESLSEAGATAAARAKALRAEAARLEKRLLELQEQARELDRQAARTVVHGGAVRRTRRSLGIRVVGELTAERRFRVRIESVKPGSAAKVAGLEDGDRIERVGGVQPSDLDHFGRLVGPFRDGFDLTFGVLRGDRRLSIKISPQRARRSD